MFSRFIRPLSSPRTCLAISLLTGSAVLGACSDVSGELPDKVAITEVIASSSSGIFREGCASVIYRLDCATAGTMIEQGLGFFRNIEPPRNQNPDNPYSEWMETPLPNPEASHIFAVRAIGGCEGDGSDFRAREIEQALTERGSFYALTGNKEGMILAVPRAGLAAFLYFG